MLFIFHTKVTVYVLKKRRLQFFPFIHVLNFWVPERARVIFHDKKTLSTQVWVHEGSGVKGYLTHPNHQVVDWNWLLCQTCMPYYSHLPYFNHWLVDWNLLLLETCMPYQSHLPNSNHHSKWLSEISSSLKHVCHIIPTHDWGEGFLSNSAYKLVYWVDLGSL